MVLQREGSKGRPPVHADRVPPGEVVAAAGTLDPAPGLRGSSWPPERPAPSVGPPAYCHVRGPQTAADRTRTRPALGLPHRAQRTAWPTASQVATRRRASTPVLGRHSELDEGAQLNAEGRSCIEAERAYAGVDGDEDVPAGRNPLVGEAGLKTRSRCSPASRRADSHQPRSAAPSSRSAEAARRSSPATQGPRSPGRRGLRSMAPVVGVAYGGLATGRLTGALEEAGQGPKGPFVLMLRAQAATARTQGEPRRPQPRGQLQRARRGAAERQGAASGDGEPRAEHVRAPPGQGPPARRPCRGRPPRGWRPPTARRS